MSASTLKLIFQAIRPATLLTGAAPVMLGASVGYMSNPKDPDHPQLLIFIVSVLAVVVMQAAANLVNDAKDAENGVDSSERKGPVRVVQSGLLDLATVKKAYKFCFVLSIFLSAIIAYYGGIYVFGAALVSALFAYAYTGGPFPLAYYAMGEVTAFIFFGLVAVAFSAYLQANSWLSIFWLWGVGPGLISAAIMAINNYRDIDTDRTSGKHTLATIFPKNLAMLFPLIFSFVAIMCPFLIRPEFMKEPFVIVVSTLLILFLLVKIYPRIKSDNADKLNEALRMTAMLNLLYCASFACINLFI